MFPRLGYFYAMQQDQRARSAGLTAPARAPSPCPGDFGMFVRTGALVAVAMAVTALAGWLFV